MSLSKMIQFINSYNLVTKNLTTIKARALFKKVSQNLKEIDF